MHGIIFNQFFKFLRDTYSQETLSKVKEACDLSHKFYDASKSHPDEEIEKLLESAAAFTKKTRAILLEELGVFISPLLMKTYAAFIDPKWGCLDLFERVESVMHRAVRSANPNADPPELKIKRKSPNEVEIEYYSKRAMSDFGIGLIKGISGHFKETVLIRVTRLGGSSCIIKVSKQ